VTIRRALSMLPIAVGMVCLTAWIVLPNTPPIADFEVQAGSDGTETSVRFDASPSRDSDGIIVTYQWLFGDGTTGSGATKEHTYPAVSAFVVTLVVTDNHGASHLTSRTINLSQPLATPATAPRPQTVAAPAAAANVPVGTHVGARAPEFALPDFGDSIVRLSDFLGQVVLLEFWSSGCSACVASLPYLESLRLAYGDRGFVVLDVATNRDYREAANLLAKGGYTEFISVREVDATSKETATAYGVVRIPHAFLIDRTGVVRFNGHLSYLRKDTIEAWL